MKKYSVIVFILLTLCAQTQQTQKPPLHGKKYMAIAGKPLAAVAGARIFEQGGNAVDAACAMIGVSCTMWDVLSWGGETQALIYNPQTKKVIGINGLGVAPSGATPQFFKGKGYQFPPEYGPLAAVTPGTFGGICLMLANYGTMHLYQILEPSLDLAAGYPIEAQTANSMESNKERLKQWKYSKKVFFPHLNQTREAPEAGEIFIQEDLKNTLIKIINIEKQSLKKGKSRIAAIWDAYNEFYQGDIAKEFVRGAQEQGGLITLADLKNWQPREEEPVKINYKGIDVYKLNAWTQGPALLQALNILENFDLKSMKYNSPQYINTVYQAMNLSFADRDFYYGDPTKSAIPLDGLLSKEYAKQRAQLINPEQNMFQVFPGDPYMFQNQKNPYLTLLQERTKLYDTNYQLPTSTLPVHDASAFYAETNSDSIYELRKWAGTTTVEAADAAGWIVSVTPSGGWLPACIAGNTGIGMSQRMQSFVLDSIINPFNVVAPGKQPRVTLTPSLAFKNDKPFLCFGVQGGDTQDQNLLQFFLNMVEFDMTVQQATEAPNINSNQLWLSLGGSSIKNRLPRDGQIIINNTSSKELIESLKKMNYSIQLRSRTSGPINAIYFDQKHNTLWGGSSNNGEDYGIGW